MSLPRDRSNGQTGFELSRRTLLRATAAACPLLLAPARAGVTRPANAVSVTDVGAKGDGVADDTAAIQSAHSMGRPVFYPKPPKAYRITRSIQVSSDTSGDSATIHVEQSGTLKHVIFDVSTTGAPLTIGGMVLEGSYSGQTTGEYSHGINLAGAENVTIAGNVIRNVRGDCVYVGSQEARKASSGIVIENNTLENPFRCNVAVVCGSNVKISGNRISKPSDYVAAIDFEPNKNGFDFVRDVAVIGNQFDAAGYFIYLTSAAPGQGRMTGLVFKNNSGRAKIFCRGNAEPMVVSPLFDGNSFEATDRDGRMFYFAGVKSARLTNNVDKTNCLWLGYKSLQLYDEIPQMSANQFCGN